ncbi:hypothetical protein RhiirC2_803288 [Rhizophagus irregularis]|uniref:Uncharacterized protein n=1 Tax=Rhizophagus irregularis TaxID=588596 RepID=A0A2N1LQ81_9GLOM|nr:hypothetical protein RhiirC2_803288 [Rhizophagus irregularis]
MLQNVTKMLHLRYNVAFSQNFIRFAKSDNVVTMLFQKIAQLPSDYKKMINSLLESFHQDESNGSKIVSLGSILAELLHKNH